MTENNKYWAFLSYSRQDNGEQRPEAPDVDRLIWGDWLHAALKTFSVPADFIGQVNGRGEIIPERIHPIFQDEQEAEASLSAEIRQALEQSTCLVVVCSPRSARSLHVNETVRYFKQLGRGRYIFPIVISGEPNASDGNQPGVSPADECFVPALRHPVQPDGTLDTSRRAGRFMFVDARHGADKREILAKDHRHAEADLEMAKIHLIALLLGVGFNGLWWREQKRHFFDFAEAQRQTREVLDQVEEVRRQLQEAQRQTREAQSQALENQNLPRDVHGQIQAAQNQAVEAQNETREAQKQLQEFQSKVRDTQSQLEEVRNRALAAEGKIIEAQQQAREYQTQLETTRTQAREAQDKVQEIQNLTRDVPDQIQAAQSQLEETRQQAQDAQNKFLEAQRQVQEFQSQARSVQSQLEEARNQVHEAQGKVLEAQNQAREAQNQVREIQNQTRDAQSRIKQAQDQVHHIQNQSRNARRLIKVFAVLAVLALLAAGLSVSTALRQRKVANQALAKTATADGKFDPAQGGLDHERIGQVLRNIGGTEQARSLDQLAAWIPQPEIPEALKASALLLNDQQRSHFQKWLLIRMGWANPMSAMTNANAIEGKIVNDEGLSDSGSYFQLAVLDNWMQTDFAGAFNWVCQLPDADSQQRALDKIIPWLQSQPDSESKNKALENCIDELAKTDVSAALALAESLPAGDWRSPVIVGLFNDSLQEIMRSQQVPLPWATFLLSSYISSSAMFPVETEMPSKATNDPVQIEPKQ